MPNDCGNLVAGAATKDITPSSSLFLYGYPFVRRYSTGVHDPLLSTALYLSDGRTEVVLVANDLIWVSKESVLRIRDRVAAGSTVPPGNILVSATHTHSGPMTLDYLSNADDSAVPKADRRYVEEFEDKVVQAMLDAIANRRPAQAGLVIAHVSGIGTNRHDPDGPADPEVPVMMVRSSSDHDPIACMLVCSMHPTVLHEDSLLISSDLPGMSRQYLQQAVLGKNCPVLHHTGPCGNLTPRYVTKANTFAEAERLGQILGRAVEAAIGGVTYSPNLPVRCRRAFVDLPRRSFPSVESAEAERKRAKDRLQQLQQSHAAPQAVRTAEVDWFGAEETLSLARAAAGQELESAYRSCLPAEIQAVQVGPWSFVGWQGEIFVDFALAVKARLPNTFVISLANGDLQGYICTREAFERKFYESGNCVFSERAGEILVERTVDLVRRLSA